MKLLLKFSLLLFCILSFSQNINLEAETLINSNYFHNYKLEKFFLHTNKSIYFSGEKVWFKAYIVDDDNNLPFLETTNLFLNIYDTNYQLIESKLLFANNGMSYGEIELSKDLKTGIYFLQLDTQWNRNFKKGTIYKIEVNNLNESENQQQTNYNTGVISDSKNDTANIISFFPESQTLLEDIQNTIVFKTHNNITGKIIDDFTGEIVATLKSNSFGIGAFKILYDSNFTAILNINGKEVKASLPKARENGFIIHKRTMNYNAPILNFEFKTNYQTIEDLGGQFIFAVLHRNGSVKSVAPIKLRDDTIDYSINFSKDDVFNGTNTITLFNEQNKPISERYFFWENNDFIDIKVSEQSKENDSLTLSLKLLNKTIPANLSISVLPDQTEVYNEDYSILSSFLLSPYIKGNTSFLTHKNLNSIELDFLLQTKTYNRTFPYQNISNSPLLFKNDNGIRIQGSINTSIEDLSNYKVMLSSKENDLLLVQPLEGKKIFDFDKLILRHPTKYQLALLDEKGEIVKAAFYVFNKYTNYTADSVLKSSRNSLNETNIFISDSLNTTDLKNQDFDLSLPEFDSVEQLDEILIKAKTVREDQETKKKLKKFGIQGVSFSRTYIPDDSPYQGSNLRQYFQSLAGVTVVETSDKTTFLNNERRLKTLNNLGASPMTIILDGSPIGTDISILIHRQATEFEYIIVNHRGAGYGALYPNGVLNIVTKRGIDGNPLAKLNPNIQVSETEFGFSLPQTNYSNPDFQFNSYKSKEYFGTLDWIPNFELQPSINNLLKINIENSKGVKLIINGLNANGDLIYEVITMSF